MDTRTPPWVFVPGLDFSKEDFQKPPRVSEAQLGRVAGFEADVLRALERALAVRARIVPESWYHLEQGLLAGRYDLILSSWTPSLGTPETIRASMPYCDWGLMVVVRAEERRIASYRDLPGMRVGRYRDPAVGAALRSMGGVQFAVEDEAERLFDYLKQGRLDAVIFDSFYVRWRVARDRSFKAVGEPLNRLGYHLGVRREDGALFERVEAAIAALRASGELNRLIERWSRGAS
jgi:polar amino acid transport system substrate-binding protein